MMGYADFKVFQECLMTWKDRHWIKRTQFTYNIFNLYIHIEKTQMANSVNAINSCFKFFHIFALLISILLL